MALSRVARLPPPNISSLVAAPLILLSRGSPPTRLPVFSLFLIWNLQSLTHGSSRPEFQSTGWHHTWKRSKWRYNLNLSTVVSLNFIWIYSVDKFQIVLHSFLWIYLVDKFQNTARMSKSCSLNRYYQRAKKWRYSMKEQEMLMAKNHLYYHMLNGLWISVSIVNMYINSEKVHRIAWSSYCRWNDQDSVQYRQ
jgi:hypothetical protein